MNLTTMNQPGNKPGTDTDNSEKDFEVSGKIIIRVSLDVKARTEEEAIRLAIEDFKGAYNLNVHGYYHEPKAVEYTELIASEIEWWEE